MMLLYRICRFTYAQSLSGAGAGLYGGRWNPVGTNLLYTAGSISLACLEYLVHNYHLLAAQDICLVKIAVKTPAAIHEVSPETLPADWQEKTYTPLSTQEIGREFVREGSKYMLKVPSAVVPDEYNYLLNPAHPDHESTLIREQLYPFEMDERLFSKT